MGKEKRNITPHKGGREARFEIRITKEAKEKLFEIAKIKKISAADLIEEWTEEKYQDIQKRF